MKKIIAKYQNGNTEVTILNDGTKIREYEGIPNIEFPESLDIKITNYCDLGCSYCHENSTIQGTHAHLDILLIKLKELPAGIELAIGGGNPLSHPEIYEFLIKLKELEFIANITVNQKHIESYYELITRLISEDLIKGLGISIVNNDYTNISKLMKLTNNIVFHIIMGINDINVISELKSISNYCKVLILGYKTFGRGINYKSDIVLNNINNWCMHLPKYFNSVTLSFDNLAIEQLDLKRFFTTEGWNKFYMGDDFTFTMYIDAVKQNYAPTSRSENRVSFNDSTLIDYFKNNKGSKI